MTLQFNTGSSWYPVLMSLNMFMLMLSFIIYLKFNNKYVFFSVLILIFMIYSWYRDLIRESLYIGSQNNFMVMSIKIGMIMMIVSELFFFISFFWTFLHFMLMNSGDIGYLWPPVNISSVNYMSVPLLNTLMLLSSGVSLTVSHMYFLLNNMKMKLYLFNSILLGVMFTLMQFWEYFMLEFLWSSSSFGSIFFMGTGFHGVHVIIGFVVLSTLFMRTLNSQINSLSNLFEMASWYWHFVDVIWIVLFTEFYWFSW